MRYAVLFLSLSVAACSSSPAPTAPTPVTVVNVPAVTPTTPVVTPTPTPTTPAVVDDGLTKDPRFSLSFYRMFALGGGSTPLARVSQAPALYLLTVDDAGNTVDARTLNTVAAAMESVAGMFTGKFGLEGIERGTGTTVSKANRITVSFSANPQAGVCGSTNRAGGNQITLNYRVAACQCGGVIRPLTAKHELGHALGFYHTDSVSDLMTSLPVNACDQNPSAREQYHGMVAYSRPIGSLDP